MAETSSKAPDAFRTISEVAEDLDLPQHVLRFWETRFNQIKPMKRGGGRRYYRPEDVDLLRGIRVLLYAEGFTIRGVQRVLKEKGAAYVAGVGQGGAVKPGTAATPEGAQSAAAVEREPAAAADAGSAFEAADRSESEIGSDLDVRTDPGFAPEEEPEAQEEYFRADPQPEPVRAPVGFTISQSDRRRLEFALADLLEAKRLLDQVR